MGIVGFGRIGQRVGQLASAFGMRVLVHTRTRRIDPPYAPFAWADLADLVEASDVISFHCPLTAENEKLVDDNFLGGAKPGAFLINTARGALIDEPSLARALASGRLAGAALDVVSEEPIRPDNPLLGAPNLANDVWLYGRSFDEIAFTIRNGRNGNMPSFAEVLGEQ